jgi:hypothetical protein
LALFRETLVAIEETASGFPSIKVGGLGYVSSGRALSAEGEEFVVYLLVDFKVEANGTGTSRVFKR